MPGRLLILAAAVLWSTSGFFVKSPWLADLGDPARAGPLIACYRTLFAALALAPFVPWGRARWRPGLLLLVGSFAAMNVLFVTAMTAAQAGDVIFLQYTAPFWVMLPAIFWLGEWFDENGLLAMGLGLGGICIIALGSEQAGSWQGNPGLGAILALGSGIGYAGVTLSMRHLRDEDPAWLAFVAHLGSGLLLLPWVPPGSEPVIGLSATNWVALAGLGGVQMAGAYWLYARGLRTVTAQDASVLTLLEPVLNPVWVLLAWGQPIGKHTLAGGAFILAGLGVKYLRPTPPPEAPDPQAGEAKSRRPRGPGRACVRICTGADRGRPRA